MERKLKFSALFSRLVAGLLLAMAALLPMAANAATPNYALAAQEQVIPFHISGQYIATTTSVAKFAMPFGAKLVGVSVTARASGGTSPTLAVDVKQGGTTVLSAPIAVTAGTISEGAIVTSTISDEGVVTVDLTIGGTSPTWNDITLLLTVVRR